LITILSFHSFIDSLIPFRVTNDNYDDDDSGGCGDVDEEEDKEDEDDEDDDDRGDVLQCLI